VEVLERENPILEFFETLESDFVSEFFTDEAKPMRGGLAETQNQNSRGNSSKGDKG
jgi:hypothetical protein